MPIFFEASHFSFDKCCRVVDSDATMLNLGQVSQWRIIGLNETVCCRKNGRGLASLCHGFDFRRALDCGSREFNGAASTSIRGLGTIATTLTFDERERFPDGDLAGRTGWGSRGSSVLCVSQHVGGGSVERNDAAAVGPLVRPDAKLTAEEAVKLQLDALAYNDDPRLDHGLEVMYHFANAEGTLDGGTLSRYFGFASDLYHFGHFALKFKTRYPELISHHGYEIHSVKLDGDKCQVCVKLLQPNEGSERGWVFALSKCARGRQPPCWLTSALLRSDSSPSS